MKLKVLIIGYVWPEPRSSGAGVRMMELIRLFLEQQWQVTFATPSAETEQMADLEQLAVKTVAIKLNDSSFDAFVTELAPDIVLFDRFMMEEQFGWRVEKTCPNALRLIELIDLHCLREARHRASKTSSKVTKDVSKSLLFSEMARREIASIYRCDLTLLISDYEQQLLQEQFNVPPALMQLTPFMFDESQLLSPTPAFEARKVFITIGNFRHAPNWDSVLWLKQTLWPLIRKQLPDAELHIYGSYPPKKATELNKPAEGFYVDGWAPDALDVMKHARVCLAPLRFGAGIKGKLADAMLAGTPSVTTRVGAEGMTGGLPWCGSVVDEPEAFANAAVELYRNRDLWLQAQQRGSEIVRHLFNKKSNGNELTHRINSSIEHLDSNRENNFIGSMLRHHHHRSTEFMSRWIQAKNSSR